MKTSSIFITALLAGTAGAVVATLFAPDKGEKTRKNIAKKSQEYKDFIVENYNDLTDPVFDTYETLEDETKRLSKTAKDKAKDIKSDIKSEVNNA